MVFWETSARLSVFIGGSMSGLGLEISVNTTGSSWPIADDLSPLR
jgi:hypothetical protein